MKPIKAWAIVDKDGKIVAIDDPVWGAEIYSTKAAAKQFVGEDDRITAIAIEIREAKP